MMRYSGASGSDAVGSGPAIGESGQWGIAAAQDVSKNNSPFTCRKEIADESILWLMLLDAILRAFYWAGCVFVMWFHLTLNSSPPIFSVNFRGFSFTRLVRPTMLVFFLFESPLCVSRSKTCTIEGILPHLEENGRDDTIYFDRDLKSWSDIQYSVFKVLRAKQDNHSCLK